MWRRDSLSYAQTERLIGGVKREVSEGLGRIAEPFWNRALERSKNYQQSDLLTENLEIIEPVPTEYS